MNLRIRTFSMALVAMSAASQVYALPSDESENKEKKEERNVMLNASDANKPREIQIGLPSEDVTVYENGLPAVYSSSVHKLSAHWRSDASLKGTDLMTPSESAIATVILRMQFLLSASWDRKSSKVSSTIRQTILVCRM